MGHSPTEAKEQKKVAQYCDQRFNGYWWHTPNGGHRPGPATIYLKQEGLKNGIPDIVIVAPFVRQGERAYVGTAIELKAPYTNPSRRQYPTLFQRFWLIALKWAGFYTAVCWGADETIDLLEDLYGNTPLPDAVGRDLRVCWTCMREVHPKARVQGRRHRCARTGVDTCLGRVNLYSSVKDALAMTILRVKPRKARSKTRPKGDVTKRVPISELPNLLKRKK